MKTLLLTILVAAAFLSGCTKMPAEPAKSELIETGDMRILTEDKNGNIIGIDNADEPILVAGSLTADDYSGYHPIDNGGYLIWTYMPNFISLKYEGQSGMLVEPVYLNFGGGGNIQLRQYQINKDGSYLVFIVNGDRSITQTAAEPPYEVTFSHDQGEDSDCWKGSLNNWSESNRLAWFPAMAGDYFVIAREQESQDYPMPNALINVHIRNRDNSNERGPYRVEWYTINRQGTDDVRDDRLTPTFRLNADGSITRPDGWLTPEQIRIFLGGG